MSRTYSQASWVGAQAEWDAGEFSDEWRQLRHAMAMNGCIFPPEGTRWDSWDDDSPSQRAILIRAIRETPELLAKCARTATTWHILIERVTGARDRWREEQARLAADEDVVEGPSHHEAVQTLAEVMARIADSAGIER